jgi:hypothetical protein
VQGFPARPEDVELAGGARLPVPGARATQVKGLSLAGVLHEPQRARCCQDEAQGVSAPDALDLAARILLGARERLAIPNRDVHGPAVAIGGEHLCHAKGEVRSQDGFQRRRRLALAGLAGPVGRGATDSHDPDPPLGEPRVPQALPRVHQGPRCGGGGCQPHRLRAKG